MGCIETKIHSYEGFINSYERKLRLNLITVEEIKLVCIFYFMKLIFFIYLLVIQFYILD